ncbi:hypothetical protein Godav_003588 [Gossypium davidsonii]|uniref:Uncharacterized protein n=1 Tax=Gossypium davidsonii TaxID=34287 RepID=A0A7J8SJQ5_GOSDV|nr:hypothetical protein [Gossypium davidsonii]
MESPLFDFKGFSEISDFDFMYNGNDIMVNEVATNLSKGIEDIGSANGSNNNHPVIDELNSNHILPAPANELHESPPSAPKPTQMPKTSQQVDEGVELPPPLATTNEQTQLDPMNADLNTFGEEPLNQLIESPDLPNESFLHGWSSNSNLEQPIPLGFEGNNPSLKNDDDASQTTSPPFSPLIMERTNSFPLPLEEMLLKDGVYMAQSVYSERRVNSVQANQLNSHIGSSLPKDRVHKTQPDHSERRANSIKANNLNSYIGSNLSKDGAYIAKSVYLERRDNSVEINKLNGHVGSSLQDGPLSCSPQREDLVNQGRRVTFADQFQQNKGNNNSNGNQQPLAYPNLTPQSLTGVGILHGRSTQINRQASTWNSYKGNNFYRPLAPARSQADEFRSIGNSDSQQYNFIQPRFSALLRSQQNNPSQLLNQVPNRPNASDSLLKHSMLTKHSIPSQFMSQNLSYQQHDQVSMTAGAYNPRTYSTRLTESSMPLRTSTLSPNRQTNPLDVSNLRYRNSLQPRSSTLSNSRYNFQDLNDYQDHQIDQFNLMTSQLGSQVSNSMLQDSLMHSGSYHLPHHQQASSQFSVLGLSKLPHHQQASSQFSMPCLSNPDLYNSKLPESSILQRLLQQEVLLNQPATLIPTYPLSGTGTGTGTSISSIVFNSLLQNETGGTSTSQQVGTPLSNYRKRKASRRKRPTAARTRYGLGEPSSSLKRFRREPSTQLMPQRDPSTMSIPKPIPVPNAEHENRDILSMHKEINTSSSASNLSGPRAIKNSLYDPLFEGIGLPVDPHLRMFATM